MKRWEGWSPDGVYILMVALLFSVWAVAMIAILSRLYIALRKQLALSVSYSRLTHCSC